MSRRTFFPVSTGVTATIIVAAPAAAIALPDVEVDAGLTLDRDHVTPLSYDRSATVTLSALSAGNVPVERVSPDQWYFWTTAWQREEARAMQEYAAGQFHDFDSVEDLLSWLDSDDA